MIRLIKSDLERYCKPSFKNFIIRILFDTNFSSVFIYRLSNYFNEKNLKVLSKYLVNLNKKKHGLEINYRANIGPGFKINHSVGIVIGSGVVIGENFTIGQNVTLGGNGGKFKETAGVIRKQPTIKSNVSIYAGSTVVGPIIIGDNVTVGANSLILKDIEENLIVGGNPAKIIKKVENHE